ncbi:MAG: oxygen-dependent coproporphyrinogen oxidase [Ignavibacteriales bacterium]|nr:oxygen-dependent coproporphyrinogen oxidase [Ignavibacteriales bacterium]
MISKTTQVRQYFEILQDSTCARLEQLESGHRFIEDRWIHHEGGGGQTRILQNGVIFEKGGVNTSAVRGTLSDSLARRLEVNPQRYSASGISLVLHPVSPMIPTVHTNFRYFELEDGAWWFGGGADLTPYYLFEDDVRHFHRVWKQACDAVDPSYHKKFKQWCDEYFFLPHRLEARGVGGIFFDYLKGDFEILFRFIRTCGNSFLESYVPIVETRLNEPWGEHEKEWQLLRRGRYVEFNLLYDRGTAFGLESRGRVESILMSLPPAVRWRYNFEPSAGSREDALVQVLRTPREWIQ